MALLVMAAGGFAATQLIRSDPAPPDSAPQWQPYVDYGKTFAVDLMSLNYEKADRDVDRIISGSTDQLQKDFIAQREDFKKTAADSRVVTTVTVNAGALNTLDEDRQTAEVLVAATSNVTNSSGANQEPRKWRLQLTIEKQNDSYKASKVEFVP
jgi:serine/threonine-protein kinase